MNEKDILDKISEGFNKDMDNVLADLARKSENPYEHVDTHTRKVNMPKKASIIAVIIGFGGTLFFAMFSPMAMLLCIGIMCLILGIGIAADKDFSVRRDAMHLIVLVFGLYFTLLALYGLLADIVPFIPKSESGFSRIGGSIGAILIGGCILLFKALAADYRKKTCTQLVQATCVYIREKMDSGGKGHARRVYSPIFEFVYGGSTYTVSENWGNIGIPNVGDILVLHINPNEPTEFYRDEKKSKGFTVIVCAALIAVGVLGILSMCM